MQSIDLRSPLNWHNATRFPVQNEAARHEVLIGAVWLLVPVIGWILNLGHRVTMVHNLQHGRPAWPSWRNYPRLFVRGCVTFAGMIQYNLPTIAAVVMARITGNPAWYALAFVCFWCAFLTVPGYMTRYCRAFDAREVFNPLRALRRAIEGGPAYLYAWTIVFRAGALSMVGLAGGLTFFITSAWFWQVAGYAFANVFSRIPDKAAQPRAASAA